jgi:hypothetical protein
MLPNKIDATGGFNDGGFYFKTSDKRIDNRRNEGHEITSKKAKIGLFSKPLQHRL